jgi:Coenzyme PQQ synthesis protein D (PqqD)
MTTEPMPRRHERYTVEWMDNEKMAIYLNETATVIWKLCDGTRTVNIDLLVEAFPDAASDVRADVRDTIDELVRNGALQLKPAPPETVEPPAAQRESPGDARSE